MTTDIDLQMIDLQARSKEGRGLGAGEKWIEIQTNTFLNWVNLELKGTDLVAKDIEEDFKDGVKLCLLVEALQNRKIGRVIRKPMNIYQCTDNVNIALDAIEKDEVKFTNISELCNFFFIFVHSGMSDLGTKWVRLAPNGINLGLLKIIFQYILARGAKMY